MTSNENAKSLMEVLKASEMKWSLSLNLTEIISFLEETFYFQTPKKNLTDDEAYNSFYYASR